MEGSLCAILQGGGGFPTAGLKLLNMKIYLLPRQMHYYTLKRSVLRYTDVEAFTGLLCGIPYES